MLVDEDYVRYLVDQGDLMFDLGTKKLHRFELGLRENLF
jgi:hypothetical protein